MKTAIILALFIAGVFSIPVKRSASSSESSEEIVVVQSLPLLAEKAPADVLQAEPTQISTTDSNESTDSADDTDEDTDEESESKEEDENDSSESSEENDTTIVPDIIDPSIGPIINTGRGDSMGYPSDYKKSIIYMDPKDFEKLPSPYKSSGKMGGLTFVSKKTSAFDDQSINEVEKGIQVVTALQVHDPLPEDEDTSTPEEELSERQGGLGSQEIIPAVDKAVNQESESAGDSASASQENEEASDSSQSSEETTATPGATDSQEDSSQSTESQESDSDEDVGQTTEPPIILAK